MSQTANKDYLTSSFRDPSGRVYKENNKIYREINHYYQENFEFLMSSGLYNQLIKQNLIIPHQEVDKEKAAKIYKIIQPEKILFISYPYEWSFSQLKDAALVTLQIQKIALDHGMSLKDASVYNIQSYQGKPVLIDTLSFEKYQAGMPWVAYKQFCQHFLAPLILASCKDIRLIQLLRVYLDGIPLDLTAKLLPTKTKFKFSSLIHIHLHAESQKKYQGKAVKKPWTRVNLIALKGIIDSLESLVKSLNWKPKGTEWADYYQDTNYSDQAFQEKKQLVKEYIQKIEPKMIWDLGANDGTFSRIATNENIPTIAFDIDPSAVEKNYLNLKKTADQLILPLVQDLTNPSSSLGWANEERDSLIKRGPVDLGLALALIHHLAISNNLPFSHIARFFAETCRNLVIEFVPKDDSQVQRLLTTREDIFTEYNQEQFEKAFSENFNIVEKELITGTKRTIFLMKKIISN